MKRTVLALAALCVTVSAFAQGNGQLTFANQVGTAFISPVYGVNPGAPGVSQTGNSALGAPVGSTVYGGPLLSGTNYQLGLFVANAGVSDLNLFTRAAVASFRVTANPAALPNGLITSQTVTFASRDAGTTVNFFVAAWDTLGGAFSPTTYAQLLGSAGAIGVGSVVTSGPLGGTAPDNSVFLVPASTGWSSFSLFVVPEPSTLALAGLGVGALLLFRRRK